MDSIELKPPAAGIEVQQAESQERHAEQRRVDNLTLAKLGKKQVLKRNFGFVSMLSFSCTVLVTWEAVLVLFEAGFVNGGPAGLIYQFIFIWAGTLSTFLTISELASIAPTAGGQYHWVYMFAPRSTRLFLSYLTGWMTVLAWQATLATAALLFGTQVQGMLALNDPAYEFQRWHGTLLNWAGLAVAIFVNTVVSSMLPKIESMFMVLHILGFFAILIPLVYMAPHAPASEALTLFLNEGGWSTQGLSFMVGMTGIAFAFVGGDAAVHMSEEIENAALNVPRSIVVTVLLNGSLGFGILIATLFSIQDNEAALETPTHFPYIEIFLQSTQSIGGTTAMTIILTLMAVTSSIGFVATSSRMIWSFARDRGLPFSDTLGRVNKRTSIPLGALLSTTVVAIALALINIGSTAAFNAVTSLSIAGFYSTYFACCAALLWRRCRPFSSPHFLTSDVGHSSSHPILEYGPDGAKSAYWDPDLQEYRLVWGPWRLPKVLGIVNNVFACAYMAVVFFFSFWPAAAGVDAVSMNYSCLVFGAVVLFSVAFYFVRGREQYRGPVIEIVD